MKEEGDAERKATTEVRLYNTQMQKCELFYQSHPFFQAWGNPRQY